jgi:ABC-type spermidine/putrescine transport systems, ATPase components
MSNSAQSRTNSHSDGQANSTRTNKHTFNSSASDEGDNTDEVLELCNLQKQYGTETVVDNLSLSVNAGEILTLLGPSGCGKTTTLRLIAGLEAVDGGMVRLNGKNVSGSAFVPPEQRGVGVVFQEFALFPHLTARENVAFGLTEYSSVETDNRVDELLELVDLPNQGESYPDELSGGQQQRVALARSLAPEPDILLLDEPFSNLDVDLRVAMREEVRRILKETGVTAISVTHDQEEALSISDRVAVMSNGHIEQVGNPETVFQHPESRFVASFLGYASFIPGYVSGDVVQTKVGTVPREQVHGLASEYNQTRVDLLVRPDDVSVCHGNPDTSGTQSGDQKTMTADDASHTQFTDKTASSNNPDPDLGTAKNGHVDTQTDECGCGEVVARRYLGPTFLYEVKLETGESVQCMHNHDENIPESGVVDIKINADHELAWFPREQRPDETDERYPRGI